MRAIDIEKLAEQVRRTKIVEQIRILNMGIFQSEDDYRQQLEALIERLETKP